MNIQGLSVGRDGRALVQGLDLQLAPGQCWALLGKNGAGKSTLLQALAGLLPYQGEAQLAGLTLRTLEPLGRARQLGLLLQDPEPSLTVTVAEAVAAGRFPWHGPFRAPSAEDRRLSAEALTLLKLDALQARPLDGLSGGERRRVQLAALLAQDPAVWLLDEPMNHLDWRWQQEALCLLAGRQAAGRRVMVALHDLNLAERLCSHALLLLGEGAWLAGPLTEVLSEARASALYELSLQREQTASGVWWHPGRPR